MKRLLPRVLILVLLAILASPGRCLACSCVIPAPDQALARADVVFRGQLVTFSQQQVARYKPDGSVEQRTMVRAAFLVNTTWKGEVAPVVATYGWEIDIGVTQLARRRGRGRLGA